MRNVRFVPSGAFQCFYLAPKLALSMEGIGTYSVGKLNPFAVNEPSQLVYFSGSQSVGPFEDARVITVHASNSGPVIVGRSGAAYQMPRAGTRGGIQMFGPEVSTVPTAGVGSGCTLNASGYVDFLGERWFEVSATAISGSNNWFEIRTEGVPAFSADCVTLEFQSFDLSNLSQPTAYLGTAGYALFSTDTRSLGAPSTNDSFRHFGTMSFSWQRAAFSKNGFSGELTDQAWVNAKVRFTVTNGTTAVVRFRSMTVAANQRRARLAISVDDGYISTFRLGYPMLRKYGFPFSCAIIADKVNDSNYMGVSLLAQIVADGNECVAHGPIGGVGNLFSGGPAYTTDAQRVADMNFHRSFLDRNGLLSEKSAQVYVWPQGRYSDTNGSPSTLLAAQAAGFSLARAATVVDEYFLLDPISYSNGSRMTLPVVGHSYAGAPNSPGDAAETTNINNIIGRIQACAAARMDCVLMLHEFVGRGQASTAIQIEMDRLDTLCSAIKTLETSGTLDVVKLSDLTN